MAQLDVHHGAEAKEITAYKESLTKQAEQMVFEAFPQKILELNQSLENGIFSVSDLSTVHCDLHLPSPPSASCNGPTLPDDQPHNKKRKLEMELETAALVGSKLMPPKFCDRIPINPKIASAVEFVKPEVILLVDRCNLLKIWIQLMVPKIEDGNNFGVGIQEEILGEVSKAESDAASYLEQVSRYYSARGKLISKAAKYPHLDDYQHAIDEYDEKVFLSFKMVLRELRNIYVCNLFSFYYNQRTDADRSLGRPLKDLAVLYDVIRKNREKLLHPRSSNSTSLY